MNEISICAAPYEEPVSSRHCLTNNVYKISSVLPHEMAESMKAEEQFYYTLCEDEENVGPLYCEPSCDEQKIYVEFEGKRFSKLHHKEIV